MTTDTHTIEQLVTDALERFGAEPDAITRDATFEELNVDSLDLAELSQIVESELGVELTSSDVAEVRTVNDAIELISSRAQP
jgi:acyl carrier protein